MLVFISIAMVGIGLVRGAKLTIPFKSWDKFCDVANVFFGGALFRVSDLSPWIEAATKINPMTFGLDAMRDITFGKDRKSYRPKTISIGPRMAIIFYERRF
jgi:ABC-type polysaccharide/polyol phosphate export permease